MIESLLPFAVPAILLFAGGADPNDEARVRSLRYTVEIKTDAIKEAGRPGRLDLQTPEIKLGGDLWLTAKLHNDGDKPVRVYWGDYAWPKMYRFDVTHESGWKPPVTRDWPDEYLPRAAAQKYFAVIQPGKSASYDLLLTPSPGGNCEHCYFNRPGRYAISPSLVIATDQILDEATGATRAVPGVWTGSLEALPLILKVAGDPKILDEGVRIRGAVLDAAGKPVPKALVTVQHRVASFGGFDGFVTLELAQELTDAEGRFDFFRLPADSPSFDVNVRHAELLSGRAIVFNNAPPGAKKRSYDTKVTLEAGRTVRGRVEDSKGKPIADVRLTMGVQRYVYSDTQGRFTLSGLPPRDEQPIQIWRRGFTELNLKAPPVAEVEREWVITLGRESERSISGTAAFVNGEPLQNMQLVFEIEVRDSAALKAGFKTWERQAQTDNQGHFTLVLPEPVECQVRSVTAFAPGERHLPTGIWRTTLGRVTARQQDVKLVFDDTHSLAAEVIPVRPVPEAFSLRVQCESLAAQRLVAEITLDHKGGAAEFKKLSPGKYRVTAAVMPNGYLTTSKEIEIAAVAEPKAKPAGAADARLNFNFPDLRFGRLIGQVVTPDGEPAPQAQIHFDGRGMSGFRDLDANARFEFEQFPVGKAWLSPRLKGYDDRSTPVDVREGRTEVVQVVLKPLAEVMADVKGRILYEDGTPVLGAGIGAFNPRRVDGEGIYQVRVRSEQPTFSIDLKNADAWPRLEPAKRLAAPYQRNMLSEALNVTLPVEPGQTTRRDIILDRTKLGRVTVNWKGPETQVQVTVSVVPLQIVPHGGDEPKKAPPDKGDKTLDDQLLFSQHMFVTLEKNGKLVLPDVPHGRRTVVMWPNDFSSARFRALPAAQADAEVTFDPDEDGGVQFRLLDAAGKPRPKPTFELGAIIPGQEQRLRFWRSPDLLAGHDQDDDLPPSPFIQKDGSFLIEHLQPGRYELLVREGKRSKTLAVEIKPRETTAVDVRVEELMADPPDSP